MTGSSGCEVASVCISSTPLTRGITISDTTTSGDGLAVRTRSSASAPSRASRTKKPSRSSTRTANRRTAPSSSTTRTVAPASARRGAADAKSSNVFIYSDVGGSLGTNLIPTRPPVIAVHRRSVFSPRVRLEGLRATRPAGPLPDDPSSGRGPSRAVPPGRYPRSPASAEWPTRCERNRGAVPGSTGPAFQRTGHRAL